MEKLKALFLRYRKPLYYLFCSILSTVVDTVVVWCLYHLFHVDLVISNTVGVVVGFVVSYVLSSKRVFSANVGIASFLVYFATFLLGLVCADALIYWTDRLVSPVLPKAWAFLVSKGVSIVVPFFLMYYIRKVAFRLLARREKEDKEQ